MTGILVRRGNLDTQRDTRGMCALRDSHVRSQRKDGHLQAKEKGLRETEPNQTYEHLILHF